MEHPGIHESTKSAALIVGMMTISWLGMLTVHEAGHVLGAWSTGGTVVQVVLHPLQISRTDVQPNPSPQIVVWAGPVLGVAAPLLAWAVAHQLRWNGAYLLRFFAGFCCVANGAYIGTGAVMPVGDAKVMRALGAPPWLLAAFGILLIPAGLLLWNGQRARFGIGSDRVPVDSAYVIVVYGLLIVLILGQLWL